jgi:hypothetical protein
VNVKLPLKEWLTLSSSSTSFCIFAAKISCIHFVRCTLSMFILFVRENGSGTVMRPAQLAAVGERRVLEIK